MMCVKPGLTSMAKELADMLVDTIDDGVAAGATPEDVKYAIEAAQEWLELYRQMHEQEEE